MALADCASFVRWQLGSLIRPWLSSFVRNRLGSFIGIELGSFMRTGLGSFIQIGVGLVSSGWIGFVRSGMHEPASWHPALRSRLQLRGHRRKCPVRQTGLRDWVRFFESSDAPGLQTAKALGLPCSAIDSKGFDRETYDRQVIGPVARAQRRFICLAGYMRLLSGYFVREFS